MKDRLAMSVAIHLMNEDLRTVSSRYVVEDWYGKYALIDTSFEPADLIMKTSTLRVMQALVKGIVVGRAQTCVVVSVAICTPISFCSKVWEINVMRSSKSTTHLLLKQSVVECPAQHTRHCHYFLSALPVEVSGVHLHQYGITRTGGEHDALGGNVLFGRRDQRQEIVVQRCGGKLQIYFQDHKDVSVCHALTPLRKPWLH